MTEIAINPRNACQYCKGSAEVTVDASQGCVICTGCGLVLEDHCFDDGREWRVFAADGVDSQAPARERADATTGIDELTGEVGGTTLMGAGPAVMRMQTLTRRAQNANAPELTEQQKQEKQIQQYTDKAREVASRLNLGEEVVNRCTTLMQELAEKNKLKSHMKVPFFCALVEMACREEGITKTVHDLAQANSGAFAMKAEVELLQVQPLEGRALRANFKAPQATKVLAKSLAFDGVQVTLAPLQRLPGSNEATCMVTWQGAREAHAGQIEEHLRKQVDELNQAKHEEKIAKNIAKQSQLLCIDLGRTRTRISSVEEDLAKRYVARLGLAAQVVAPAMHIANQALQHDFVKQGKGLLEHSLAAAAMASAIFIVAWLLDAEIKPRLADVATVVKVSEGSVQTAYRQMREQIRKLLPKGFVIQHKLGVEGLPKLEEKTRKRSADLM